MPIVYIILGGAFCLFVATRLYPRWIARVFSLNDLDTTPAEDFADGRDYVKSTTPVVFGHHFASIAGAGPIVGPIIALAYGWAWGLAWIVLGGIFFGAVHDMASMCVSLREGGKTIAEIARRTLGNFGYLLFVLFLLIVLSVINAIFLKLSASALSSAYPIADLQLPADQTLLRTFTDASGIVYGRIGGIATTSVILMTLFAPILGWLLTRRGLRVPYAYLLGAAVCVIGVVVGFSAPVSMPTNWWMIILAVYAFIACWVPVWLLLQPRDFMNVQLLYGGLILLIVGALVAGVQGETMQIGVSTLGEAGPKKSGPLWPIMFITIACGAISGFHSLVATGTTIKQIPRQTDCRRIGYGAMILESFLALLVLVAVGSQLTSIEYSASMSSAGGAIQTFAIGCGNLFAHLGINKAIGSVLGILVIEGFLITTLDTALRLARYLCEELWSCLFRGAPPKVLRNPLVNTGVAVALMLLIAYSGEASRVLWPFFGAGNQLIGALTLTTVSLWLLKRRKPYLFTAIPAVFMVVTAVTALGYLVVGEFEKGQAADLDVRSPLWWAPAAAGSMLLLLAIGFVIVAMVRTVQAVRDQYRGLAVESGEIEGAKR